MKMSKRSRDVLKDFNLAALSHGVTMGTDYGQEENNRRRIRHDETMKALETRIIQLEKVILREFPKCGSYIGHDKILKKLP